MKKLSSRPAPRPEPVSDQLTDQLLDFLLSGEVQIGQRIPSERRLAEEFAVGRSAVRDALRPLAALGLLDVRIGDGTYLNDPDGAVVSRLIAWGGVLLRRSGVGDLIEARRHIEVAIAGLAAERRDDRAVDELRRLLDKISSARTPNGFSNWDTAFHLRIAEASGNATLSGILHGIRGLLRVWIYRVMDVQQEFELSFSEHLPIFNAIEGRDRLAAQEAMADHLDSATRRLLATLEPRPRTIPPVREEARGAGG